MAKIVELSLPRNFNFKSTVYSHGWCELPPFDLDDKAWKLSCVFSSADGRKHSSAVMSGSKSKVTIELRNAKVPDAKVVRDAAHILRLDDDLRAFYSHTSGHEGLEWVAAKSAGRLLRSATVWEDLIKTLCTTNCSWGLTKIMVRNLVEKLGDDAGGGKRAFPMAERLAEMPEKFFREEIKAGYRSPYFVELAQNVADGNLDPESWLHSELSTADLKKEMKAVKGVGDYAAENLLKLVGRYDGLALDSWLRSQFYKKHNKEKVCKDEKIERHYKKFGEWKGLAIWCDMTEKWIA